MDPLLVMFCGPSGSGKTTIVKHLISSLPELSFSVSATTRDRRSGEVDGKDYYFLGNKEFKEKIAADQFLEWEEVYHNGFYGTMLSEIDRISNNNKIAIFDVDVKGGLAIKKRYGKNLLDVFVVPPSLAELKKRLIARESETEESLTGRVNKAEQELTYQSKFSETIVNNDLQKSLVEAEQLVRNFLKGNV